MIYKVFAIKDLKANVFQPPFTARSIGEAERLVTRVMSKPDSEYNQFKEDFELWCVAEFDDSDARFVGDSDVYTRLNRFTQYAPKVTADV